MLAEIVRQEVEDNLLHHAAALPAPEAEQMLLERGVTVIPDFIANTGAAAGAWWVILGEVVSPSGACVRLSEQIRPLVRDLMSRADGSALSVRTEGILFAKENSQRMTDEYGGAVAFRDLFPDMGPEQQFADETETEAAAGPATAEDTTDAVIGQPSGAAFMASSDLADQPLVDTGRQPAAAFPAYWPGPADEAADGQA